MIVTISESADLHTLVEEQKETNRLLRQLNHNVVNLVLLSINSRSDVVLSPTDRDKAVGMKMYSDGMFSSDCQLTYYYHPDKGIDWHEYSNMTVDTFEDYLR